MVYGSTGDYVNKVYIYYIIMFYYIISMEVKINRTIYKTVYNPIKVNPDGSFTLHVTKWIERRKGNSWSGYSRFAEYVIPHPTRMTMEFDGKKYKCNGMTPTEVLELRSHLEACLALENLK